MSRHVTTFNNLTTDELDAAKRSYSAKKKTTTGRTDRNGDLIEFRLTFDEWLAIWLASGQLLNRGLKQGQYCMSRKDDLGHYEALNVFIQLSSENARQGKANRKHTKETLDRMSTTRKGKPSWKKGLKAPMKRLGWVGKTEPAPANC